MKTKHLFFGTMILLGFLSCSDDDPEPKGEIVGLVKLFDDGTKALGNEDMTIRIDELGISATTDAEGKFTLTDIPFGTYDLIYEKPGYGSYKYIGLCHSCFYSKGSTTTIEETNLGQISPTRVTDLSVELVDNDVLLTVTTDPPGSDDDDQYIRVYWSSSKAKVDDVSLNDNSRISLILHSNPETFKIPLWELLGEDYWWGEQVLEGDEIYIKAYGESYWDNMYFDAKIGKSVHPNLNPSSTDAVSLKLTWLTNR